MCPHRSTNRLHVHFSLRVRVHQFLGEPLATSSSKACADIEGGFCVPLFAAGDLATPPTWPAVLLLANIVQHHSRSVVQTL